MESCFVIEDVGVKKWAKLVSLKCKGRSVVKNEKYCIPSEVERTERLSPV